MTISPQPAPQHTARARASYDWSQIVVGEWQRWLELTDDTITDDEARKAADRVRLAARSYARHHGLSMSTRRERHGRILDMKFEVKA